MDHPTDPADRFDAVHVRHQIIHDVDLVLILQLSGVLRTEDGLFPGHGPVGLHIDAAEHLANAAAGLDVIIHHELPRALQLGDRLISDRLVGKA